MTIPAYAKINLFLDVMERRDDGFHNIRSIMHKVTLCDYISAEIFEGDGINISVKCTSSEVPLGEDNLVCRIARLFFEKYGIDNASVVFTVDKHIPVSAGLAGGSTDAAAALILLNQLFDINTSVDELCEIGAQLGSDIPFCIGGNTSLTTGRGEVLTEIDSKLDLILVIAKGGEGVSTPKAYKKIDEMYGDTLSESFADLDSAIIAVKNGDSELMIKSMYNTFESAVMPDHKEASEAKRIMIEMGALGAMLSGSGPSVFGVFPNTETAEKVKDTLSSMGYSAHVCRSL